MREVASSRGSPRQANRERRSDILCALNRNRSTMLFHNVTDTEEADPGAVDPAERVASSTEQLENMGEIGSRNTDPLVADLQNGQTCRISAVRCGR